MNDKCCDKCRHYKWYYDYCSKWKIKMDYRSVFSCFEEYKKDKSEESIKK